MATIWFGPVNAAQSGQADAAYVTCTGDGKPSCADIAESDGRDLSKALARLRVPDGEPVILRAFSAGGHSLKRYLTKPENRARVAAVTLADAVFETSEIAAPGFVDFGVEAANGGKLFVATGSTGANATGTGAHYLGLLQAAIEKATGRRFESIDVPGLGTGMKLGGNYFFDMGSTYSHGEHATKLARIVWFTLAEPFMERQAMPTAQPTSQTQPSPQAAQESLRRRSATLPKALLAALAVGLVAAAALRAARSPAR